MVALLSHNRDNDPFSLVPQSDCSFTVHACTFCNIITSHYAQLVSIIS